MVRSRRKIPNRTRPNENNNIERNVLHVSSIEDDSSKFYSEIHEQKKKKLKSENRKSLSHSDDFINQELLENILAYYQFHDICDNNTRCTNNDHSNNKNNNIIDDCTSNNYNNVYIQVQNDSSSISSSSSNSPRLEFGLSDTDNCASPIISEDSDSSITPTPDSPITSSSSIKHECRPFSSLLLLNSNHKIPKFSTIILKNDPIFWKKHINKSIFKISSQIFENEIRYNELLQSSKISDRELNCLADNLTSNIPSKDSILMNKVVPKCIDDPPNSQNISTYNNIEDKHLKDNCRENFQNNTNTDIISNDNSLLDINKISNLNRDIFGSNTLFNNSSINDSYDSDSLFINNNIDNNNQHFNYIDCSSPSTINSPYFHDIDNILNQSYENNKCYDNICNNMNNNLINDSDAIYHTNNIDMIMNDDNDDYLSSLTNKANISINNDCLFDLRNDINSVLLNKQIDFDDLFMDGINYNSHYIQNSDSDHRDGNSGYIKMKDQSYFGNISHVESN